MRHKNFGDFLYRKGPEPSPNGPTRSDLRYRLWSPDFKEVSLQTGMWGISRLGLSMNLVTMIYYQVWLILVFAVAPYHSHHVLKGEPRSQTVVSPHGIGQVVCGTLEDMPGRILLSGAL